MDEKNWAIVEKKWGQAPYESGAKARYDLSLRQWALNKSTCVFTLVLGGEGGAIKGSSEWLHKH